MNEVYVSNNFQSATGKTAKQSQDEQTSVPGDAQAATDTSDILAYAGGDPGFSPLPAAPSPVAQTATSEASGFVAAYASLPAVSSVSPVSAPATVTSTQTSSAPASSVTASSSAVPSWISALSTASIAADMTAADVNGTVTYAGLEKLLADLDSTLASSKTSLTAAEFSDLKTVVANLNNGMSASSYLSGIMKALVDGNAANATWTGGATSSTTLGNLAAGSSATQLSELIGKWFLGTDLPSSKVVLDGYSFSVSYSASSSPLFGSAGPSMNDINQGQLGDCYLLSCLAEVAKQNSGVISSMFTSNGNNTYGVRFYVDGAAQYVTVNDSLANGGNVFNYGTDIWASLAEKAYAQLQAGGVVTGNVVNYGNSWSTIGNGGFPAYALEEITGASAITNFSASGNSWTTIVYNSALSTTSVASGSSTASVLGTLSADLSKGDDLVLSSNTSATDSSGKTTLVADHAMSIYGYDSSTGMLEIRNPWGTEAGQTWDTTFEVSLSILLSDGDTITADNIGNTAITAPPVLSAQTATQTWKLGQTVNFTLAANTFTDPQGEKLTYSATLANGSALPTWLSFNATTGTFSGTVANTASGLSVKVTATDSSGLSASETFSVLTPAPSAPTVTAQTATQTWKLGQTVSFTLAANTFTDPQGEKLTYNATLANGSPLPSWLTFNAATATFSGTVPNTASGLSIKVTATDTGGAATSETFSVLTPAGAPTVTAPTAAQTWKLGQNVDFTLAANTFSDPQGEKLTYNATLANGTALPAWLTFNAATGTFTGSVPSTTSGLSIKVTATDTSGLSASDTFSVLTPAPPAPTVAAQTGTQTWKLGQTVNFTLAANTFVDPQGETLTYNATLANGSALPAWLSFNGTTRTFSGTVPNTASGLSIKVIATDAGGASTSETFSVLTPAAAPTVTSATAAQTWTGGQSINLALPTKTFTDPQGEKLTYSAMQANGAALPSWLTFNAATETFTGTAPTTASTLSVTVKATDTSNLSVSETFSVSIVAAASKLTQAIASLPPSAGPAGGSPSQPASTTSPTLASPLH